MNISKFIQCVLALATTFSALVAFAQTPPTLNCQLYAGITITGATGSLYSIQSTSNVGDSNSWQTVGLVQLMGTNTFWTDTNQSAASGQRFYRAVQTSSNLVYILPGTFTMGSPTNEALRGAAETQHLVTFSKGIYMDKFLVTQGEYLAVVGSNPSHFTGSLNLPVEEVSWNDATNYCALRSAEEQAAGLIPAHWAYRLPTESEWEYACRAGTTTAFYLGDDLHSQQANFTGTNEYDSTVGSIYNPAGVNLQTSTVVGSYAANPWGLYDMTGNLAEWCEDWMGDYPLGNVTDPQGSPTGTTRIIRGGSWTQAASMCRSAFRGVLAPSGAKSFVGFRVVLAQAQ